MQDQSRSVFANCTDQCADSSLADMRGGEICSNRDLYFLMKAHDTLAGAIAKRAGPKRWVSGPSNACSLAYRDANEASWSPPVDVAEGMVGSTKLPVLADGDSGFGNFDNARLPAGKLRRRSAAGVALGDSCFPNLNSIVGGRHALTDKDHEFSFVARSRSRFPATSPQ